jgi:hypothetical protein
LNADRAPQLKASVVPLPMNLLLAISLLVNAAGGALNQPKTVGAFKFSKNHAGHSAVLKIRTKQFRISEHRISRDAQYQTRVDGRLAWGTDGNVPNIEIGSMTLVFDGRELSIPKNLFKDCYEPNLDDRFLKMRFGSQFKSVIVSMSGSDGAGGYEVVWRLKSNGHHSRSVNRAF